MTTLLTTEAGILLTDELGSLIILQEVLAAADVRETFSVLPRTTEFGILPRTICFETLPRTTQFELTRGSDMALTVSPRDKLDDMVAGEDYAFELAIDKELKTKTVASYTYKLYNSSGDEVTDTIGGGSSIDSSNSILFGIKAVAAGKYTLQFIVTCDDLLPDGTTPYELIIGMTVTIN